MGTPFRGSESCELRRSAKTLRPAVLAGCRCGTPRRAGAGRAPRRAWILSSPLGRPARGRRPPRGSLPRRPRAHGSGRVRRPDPEDRRRGDLLPRRRDAGGLLGPRRRTGVPVRVRADSPPHDGQQPFLRPPRPRPGPPGSPPGRAGWRARPVGCPGGPRRGRPAGPGSRGGLSRACAGPGSDRRGVRFHARASRPSRSEAPSPRCRDSRRKGAGPAPRPRSTSAAASAAACGGASRASTTG